MKNETKVRQYIGRKTGLIAIAVATVLVLFTVVAVFSIVIMRTYSDVTAENSESEYRFGDIYYNRLNYRQQYLYNSIVDAVTNFRSSTDVVPYYYTNREFERIVEYIKAENPELFWFADENSELICDNTKSRINLSYNTKYDTLSKMQNELDNKLNAAASDIIAKAGMDTSVRLLMIHDWLFRTASVTESGENSLTGTAYGAIVLGEAAADGYAAAFKMLCDKLDIYCLSIYGRVYSTNHMWNVVWDGISYRHIDVMWDDPDLKYLPELVSHAYFGLSDEEISEDHVILREAMIPDAVTPSDYYIVKGLTISKSDADVALRKMFGKTLQTSQDYFEVKVTGSKFDLESSIEKAMATSESLSEYFTGWRVYRLSDISDVYAVQVYPRSE